ncbi:MAG: hypothetical protein LUH40_05215 [Clostridiales bacterium]|nr:hypothetical protein [Clostridiales bacterium]
MKKKIISVILSCLIFVMPMTVFAENGSLPDETLIKMGDMNEDGKITAADARSALRIAAKLDSSDDVELARIDADNNGKISTSDARLILRVAASIDSFVYGFDGEGNSNCVSVLKSNNYYVSMELEGVNVILAKSGNKIYVSGDDFNGAFAGDSFSNVNCGILIDGDSIYALLAMTMAESGNTSYIKMLVASGGASILGDFDISDDELSQMANIFEMMIADDLGTPSKVTENGTAYICYSYFVDGAQYMLYTDTSGMAVRIDYVADTDVITMITFNSVSTDVPDEYFDLDMYTEF